MAHVSYKIVWARCRLISAANFLPYSIIASRLARRCFALVLQHDKIPLTRADFGTALLIVPVFFQRTAAGRFAFAMQRPLPSRLGQLGQHPGQVVVVGEAVADKRMRSSGRGSVARNGTTSSTSNTAQASTTTRPAAAGQWRIEWSSSQDRSTCRWLAPARVFIQKGAEQV